MMYDFDNIVDRRKHASVKWDVKSNELPMWIADMDFRVLPEIKEAILNRANVDAYGYTYVPEEYFDSYVYWAKLRHNLSLKREWLLYSESVVASIDSIFKHLGKAGDEVVMLTPTYNIFYNCIRNNGLIVSECELQYENFHYSIDYNNLEKLLSRSKASFLLFCNPHNPIGKIYSCEEIRKIFSIAKRHNVLIISDEIHCDITDPGISYNPALSACPIYIDSIITLVSPTKAFNLAGLQSSALIIPNKEIREKVQDGLYKDDVGEPNYFAVDAAIAAFMHGEEWNKQLREYLFKNKRYFIDFINKELPNLHVIEGQATYLLWVDISYYSSDSVSFVKKLRNKTGLYLADGLAYGRGGKTFVRINIATSLQNVKECCQRLKNYLK